MIFRKIEQDIVKIINESGVSIDAIYFIMKSIMQEIEQKYFEYCRIEDAEVAKKSLEQSNGNDELNSVDKETS